MDHLTDAATSLQVAVRQLVKEELAAALRAATLEVVAVGDGHMGTTEYYLVLTVAGQKLTTLLGDDGFNDGERLGTIFGADRCVRRQSEL